MFLTLLRLQHPLVYRYAWLRVWVVVLRNCARIKLIKAIRPVADRPAWIYTRK